MASQNCAHIWLLSSAVVLELCPGVDGDLTRVCLVYRGVEVEVAWLADDVDAGLGRVSLCPMPHTTAKRIGLLCFDVYLLADEVRITGRIRQIRLPHIDQCLDRFDHLRAHHTGCYFARDRVKLPSQRISEYCIVLINA